uniref:Rap-GAP domain-containing protein n=1 Tax=Heterorhabditis bacteriophora TaxID=37862 RepID=A0A1I7X1F6_HETBA
MHIFIAIIFCIFQRNQRLLVPRIHSKRPRLYVRREAEELVVHQLRKMDVHGAVVNDSLCEYRLVSVIAKLVSEGLLNNEILSTFVHRKFILLIEPPVSVTCLAKELTRDGNACDVARELIALDMPHFHSHFVHQAISNTSVRIGFSRFLESINEQEVDLPGATSLATLLISYAANDNNLIDEEVYRRCPRLVEQLVTNLCTHFLENCKLLFSVPMHKTTYERRAYKVNSIAEYLKQKYIPDYQFDSNLAYNEGLSDFSNVSGFIAVLYGFWETSSSVNSTHRFYMQRLFAYNKLYLTHRPVKFFRNNASWILLVWSIYNYITQNYLERTILLENCISIRAAKGQDDLPYIRLQMKDKTVFQLASPKLLKLTDILSKVTFPKKYITLAPSTSLESPTSDVEEIKFFNEYPVLLLPLTLNRDRSIAEGNYTLEFSKFLILKNGSSVEQTFHYSDLIWVATGDHCLGFENNYDRHYHPVRTLTGDSSDTSIPSTLKSQSSIEQSLTSEPMNISLDENRINENSTVDRPDQNVKNLQPTKDQGKKDSKFLGFIRRNSKKMKSDGNRTDFEENADGEWLKYDLLSRLQTPITTDTKLPMIPNSEAAQLFKKELEQTIAQNKAHNTSIFILDIISRFY